MAGAAFSQEAASPLERLTQSWVAMLATLDEHRGLIRAFVEALAHAERSPEFRKLMREHYRRSQRRVAELVEAALGPDAAGRGADPSIVSLFVIAVFDGLAVQYRMAPEETPSGEQLISALVAARELALERAAQAQAD